MNRDMNAMMLINAASLIRRFAPRNSHWQLKQDHMLYTIEQLNSQLLSTLQLEVKPELNDIKAEISSYTGTVESTRIIRNPKKRCTKTSAECKPEECKPKRKYKAKRSSARKTAKKDTPSKATCTSTNGPSHIPSGSQVNNPTDVALKKDYSKTTEQDNQPKEDCSTAGVSETEIKPSQAVLKQRTHSSRARFNRARGGLRSNFRATSTQDASIKAECTQKSEPAEASASTANNNTQTGFTRGRGNRGRRGVRAARAGRTHPRTLERNRASPYYIPTDYHADLYSSSSESSMGMYGFSKEDEYELLCQGIKPWEPEAWGALAVLHGEGDFF
ncbi:hypothetical protein EG68_10696 [Paragonimus skrjabini miyazakii]|uniref:Uncharacterized protein n=1 Tax=Paragonimus skrjabini miyazakii TaxID=59628 RepID=A0A8S9YKJ4_9TREM|nr:hypothetical protein EG68_10696 [Paragonimus skrjabini miyazakii]